MVIERRSLLLKLREPETNVERNRFNLQNKQKKKEKKKKKKEEKKKSVKDDGPYETNDKESVADPDLTSLVSRVRCMSLLCFCTRSSSCRRALLSACLLINRDKASRCWRNVSVWSLIFFVD